VTHTATPSIDLSVMLQRAADLVPVLKERSQATEQLRQIPSETIRDFISSGLIRVANPTAYGGYGLDLDAMLEVTRELGRGDGSSSWCFSIWTIHNWEMGLFPKEAQDEYFENPDVLSSSGLNPRNGKTEKVPGGYRLSGRWDFSSGCDSAAWAILASNTEDQGVANFLVPRSDWEIDDTWHVSGLKGTGSKDVTVAGAFVPEHRMLARQSLAAANTPGRELHDRASYRVPGFSIEGFSVVYPLLGIAQGALDVFEERMRAQSGAMTGDKKAENVPVQLRLAESAAEIEAAITICRSHIAEMLDAGKTGRELTLDERARYARDRAFSVKLCVQAVNRLFDVSGAHGLYDASPLQRFQRDLQAGSHQIGVLWDLFAEQYGRVRLGLPPATPFL
jgi:3-hydroxy-9,10-secoandrosta-1,3,5(10)-triene-9,17-dione monooxygenase